MSGCLAAELGGFWGGAAAMAAMEVFGIKQGNDFFEKLEMVVVEV